MGPNTVSIDVLTEDQLAMLELLGNPPEIQCRRRIYYRITAGPEDMPFDPYIGTYLCPVVMFRGRPRMILPGGDIHTVDLEHMAAGDEREAAEAAAYARAVEMAALGIPTIRAHKPK